MSVMRQYQFSGDQYLVIMRRDEGIKRSKIYAKLQTSGCWRKTDDVPPGISIVLSSSSPKDGEYVGYIVDDGIFIGRVHIEPLRMIAGTDWVVRRRTGVDLLAHYRIDSSNICLLSSREQHAIRLIITGNLISNGAYAKAEKIGRRVLGHFEKRY